MLLPRLVPHWTLLSVIVGLVPVTLLADGPVDNNPDVVRPVPKPGISVPLADLKELAEGTAKLGAMLAELRPAGEPSYETFPNPQNMKPWDLYADVAIFHRAVRVALEDHEFFDVKEIEAAKTLLSIGQERAMNLLAGKTPWLTQQGLVVRGYTSMIDHTPQPYGVVIPETYAADGKLPTRLDIWLHGRGETLSELNFISQRMANIGPISPANTIVLHPYGRYCNANKFAGEKDVQEAIASTRRSYSIDKKRHAIRGFSMGGAACWQFAVHHPSHWFAATPGAGFSETPEFLKFFQKETLNPPWWEEKLWRWYDCPGYVANLRNLPVVAYSGADDIQKQAADLMEAAYEKSGMKMPHIIAPKTGHSITPEAAKEIESRLAHWAAGVDQKIRPQKLEFVTFTQIYPDTDWVVIDRMKEQWEESRVTAEFDDLGTIVIKTKNVICMTLRSPHIGVDDTTPQKFVIDGDIVDVQFPEDRSRISSYPLEMIDGRWTKKTSLENDSLRKQPWLLCGPIDHAFMSSFIFVKPSGKCAHPNVQKWVDAEMNRAITQWRRQFRGDARVKLDSEITDEDIKSSHLVLWGDRKSNSWIEKFADTLPIQWSDAEITVGDQKFDSPQHALIAIYPNPQNPMKYIVLNSGFTYREYDYLNNARQTPKLPDWAVVDLRTPPNSRWPGKIVAADFFDEDWQLKPARKP